MASRLAPLNTNGIHANNLAASSSSPHLPRTGRDGRVFSVLSFDGGGYRGYASLIVLRYLLRLVKADGIIFPYQYFDLICGTSTGGLIAILLGVLHLDIDTTITVYTKLGRTLFGNEWRKMRFWLKNAQFNHKLLRQAVSQILTEHGNGRELMRDSGADENECLCFVTATHCDDKNNAEVFLVRSYHRGGVEQNYPHGHDWSIMDAALATSAAPTFFKRHRIRVEDVNFRFEDAGAHRANNPTELAWEECRSLGVGESYFVSIGTGVQVSSNGKRQNTHRILPQTITNIFNIHSRATKLARGFVRYGLDVMDVEHRMADRARDPSLTYYRINPLRLGDIDLADHRAIPEMQQTVRRYFEAEREPLFLPCSALLRNVYETADDPPVVEPETPRSFWRWRSW